MSLQEDGMTSLIVIDITAALEGDEGTRVRCSFREREDFGLQGKPCELVPAFFRAAEPHSHRPGRHMSVSFHDEPSKRLRGPLFGGEEMLNTNPSPVLNHLTSTLTSCSHSSIVLPLAYMNMPSP